MHGTRVLFAGLVVAAATGLTACGANEDPSSAGGSTSKGASTSEYCAQLKADKAYFGSFDAADLGQLNEVFTKLIALGRGAPDEVVDEWKVVADGLSGVQKAFEDAGVGEEDYAALEAGKFPDGVDVQKYQEAGRKFRALNDSQFTEAVESIQAHAMKACKVNLSSDS